MVTRTTGIAQMVSRQFVGVITKFGCPCAVLKLQLLGTYNTGERYEHIVSNLKTHHST